MSCTSPAAPLSRCEAWPCAPKFGGQRIGTALVAAVEAEARRLGCARVLLAVSQSNLKVRDYYLRLGYSVTGEPYARARPGRPAPVVFGKRL